MHDLSSALRAAFSAFLLTTVLLPVGLAAADGASAGAAKASTAPTTQACLGDFATFLTCPAGATVAAGSTECRQREPRRGAGPGEHWSGSQRQGPALFLRDRAGVDKPVTKASTVSFATRYKNHKKNGRLFRFDKEGRLSAWENLIDDRSYGLSVSCTPDGKVSFMATYFNDKVVGLSRAWRSDGTLSYAIQHDATGAVTGHGEHPTAEQARRPDELCRPARCDINAAPEVSGLPQGMTLPTTP